MLTREKFVYAEIRKWLTLHNHDLKWLARKTGRTYPALYHCVRGTVQPDEEFVRQISEIMGRNPWALYPAVPYEHAD